MNSRLPLVWGIDRFTTVGSGTAGSRENDSGFTRGRAISADAVPWCCNRLSACGEPPQRSFIQRSSHKEDDPFAFALQVFRHRFFDRTVQNDRNIPVDDPHKERLFHVRQNHSASLQKGKQTFVGSLLFRRHH